MIEDVIIPPSFKNSSHDVGCLVQKKFKKTKKQFFLQKSVVLLLAHFVLKREKTKQRWREEDHQEGA